MHSTKAMAPRAVALIVALLHERADVDAVARVLLEYGERPPLDLTPHDVETMRLAAARLAGVFARVPGGLCAATGCGKPYLDLGGGSPRRYCGTRCATRERVAAHRAAHP
ncbi:CGNR zinc finger domain-containing protein [Nonomuraea sp. NPDC049152]|uniref:CGNR zinc finger domain-containing protein n=1 Tax=Nonomuraea sp. NPDC049152 TaxID=3154350 RepID=UPI0033E3EE77